MKHKKKKVIEDELTELEDINPVHNEDGYKPLKVSKAARKKLIRAKIAERNADIRMKALNKFFE